MAFGQDGACGLPLQLAAWQSLAAEWGGAKKNDPIFSEGVVAASETCYFDAAL